ncbi:hydroxymethylbilane synthase [Cellulomonas sp. APG4]|uniref:hydroxymethylbilane synthase n=1 Tax=Cellulomonas sp. APG4 TaxID=1538656 RepID=UPI00137B61F3|nr:hydroxymethylbilane synthase [Cellulomonas sp. APG4]
MIRLGTRGSLLATTQSGHVADALGWLLGTGEVELVTIRTEGDRLRGSLAALGGAGVFVAALREALLEDRCDLAVHSLKDLPTAPAPGLALAAVPAREEPRDALCARDGMHLKDLPDGARVGTGSPRRAAQLRAARLDLEVVDIRGNVGTRLGRVPGLGHDGPGDLDAVVLAAAGLERLGMIGVASEVLDRHVLTPAPGQGALAVEVRAGDELGELVARLDDLTSRLEVTAERSLLATLEAGCAAPIGALARVEAGDLVLEAVVCRPDGGAQVRTEQRLPLPHGVVGVDGATHHDPQAPVWALEVAVRLGADVAHRLLDDGAAELAPLVDGRR